MEKKMPEGWLNVAGVILGYIIIILAIIIILIVSLAKPKSVETEEPILEEEPLTLEEMLNHDLAFAYAKWEYQEIEEEPEEDIPFFTEVEKWLIARVVMSEASTESFEVKEAVAETVINRVFSDYREFRYQTAVDEVCLKPSQWATDQDPTDECYEAVETAIRENRHPDDMLWARRDYVDYGNEYTVEEGSRTKFSTVNDYNKKE